MLFVSIYVLIALALAEDQDDPIDNSQWVVSYLPFMAVGIGIFIGLRLLRRRLRMRFAADRRSP